jgi:cysteine desulfurase
MPHHYFDHNATSPLTGPVRTAYFEALEHGYGNASSIHQAGQLAKQRLESARRRVAAQLGASAKEIIFVSGGTEGDNLALRGLAGPGDHIVISAIEHPAILATAAAMERAGTAVTIVGVRETGVVEPESIRQALTPATKLVSVMHANNELGTVQPLAEIAKVTRAAGVLLHSDGVQTFGKMECKMSALGVDLYTVSGHKIGAPKGIGALFVRKGVPLSAISFGGHHEGDRRPGTENVEGAVALAVAAETADWRGVAELRDRLEQQILTRVDGAHVNGQGPRTPNTTNIRFDGIEGEALLIALDLQGFRVSSGAACSSGAVEPSHVLLAIGLAPRDARSSLRFSLGPLHTAEDVDSLAGAVEQVVAHLRRISTDPHPTRRELLHA